jgi:hypothetical protein
MRRFFRGTFKMTIRTVARAAAAGATALVISAGASAAVSLNVTVTNLQGEGGLFLTPIFSIFHDGTYDSFTAGELASPGVEAIAEEGDVSVELAATAGRNNGVILAPGGFPGAPVLDPGETVTTRFTVDPTTDRFFSFLSMIIPSNDLFIGNGNQTAYEVFDAAGNFTGIGSIFLTIANIYDAGTEVNDNLGAAFNANGGISTDTSEFIQLVGDISFLDGQPTAAGTNVSLFAGGESLLRIDISVVPVPAALPLLLGGIGALGLLRRRRKA